MPVPSREWKKPSRLLPSRRSVWSRWKSGSATESKQLREVAVYPASAALPAPDSSPGVARTFDVIVFDGRGRGSPFRSRPAGSLGDCVADARCSTCILKSQGLLSECHNEKPFHSAELQLLHSNCSELLPTQKLLHFFMMWFIILIREIMINTKQSASSRQHQQVWADWCWAR